MFGFVWTWPKIDISEFPTFVCLLLKCCVVWLMIEVRQKLQKDLSTVSFFQLLTRTSLGKSANSAAKIAFKLVELPRLKLICWKLKKTSFSNSRYFTEVCMVGASLCSHHTNDCKISQLFGATVIFSRLRRITFKLDNCTNFKALFPLLWRIFPNWYMSKVVIYMSFVRFAIDLTPHRPGSFSLKCQPSVCPNPSPIGVAKRVGRRRRF